MINNLLNNQCKKLLQIVSTIQINQILLFFWASLLINTNNFISVLLRKLKLKSLFTQILHTYNSFPVNVVQKNPASSAKPAFFEYFTANLHPKLSIVVCVLISN